MKTDLTDVRFDQKQNKTKQNKKNDEIYKLHVKKCLGRELLFELEELSGLNESELCVASYMLSGVFSSGFYTRTPYI